MKQVYILVGPPGSGKGTQAELLARELGIKSFSSGQILREEIIRKTVIGREADRLLRQGLFMPDDIVCKMMIGRLKSARKAVIFDGFPRNLAQAKIFNDYLEKHKSINTVIDINLSLSKIFDRILGRLSCQCGEIFHRKYRPPKKKGLCDYCGGKLKKRSDDNEKTLRARLRVYQRETKPIIKYYQKKKGYQYFRLNGGGSVEAVNRMLIKKVKNK